MSEDIATEAQKRALHLWFRQSAQVLNDAGLSQQAVIQALVDRGLEIPWTDASFKECVWKPIYKVMSGKTTTTTAGGQDYNAEYMGLCKWAGQTFGVTLPPWPTRFTEGEG